MTKFHSFIGLILCLCGVSAYANDGASAASYGRLTVQSCRESIQVPEGSYCDVNCRANRQFKGRAICSSRPAGSCSVTYSASGGTVSVSFSGQSYSSYLPAVPKFGPGRYSGIARTILDFGGFSGTLYSYGSYARGSYAFHFGRPVGVDVDMDHDSNGNYFTRYNCSIGR